uniref:Uncharacterized protein n=1 Tax=Chelydra serpentina TaxID=8475 RepID=A0A8C3S5Y5_CHESE
MYWTFYNEYVVVVCPSRTHRPYPNNYKTPVDFTGSSTYKGLNCYWEKNAGSRCVISMNTSSTSIYDPKNPGHMKTFTFDLAYWSHSGFLKDKDGIF